MKREAGSARETLDGYSDEEFNTGLIKIMESFYAQSWVCPSDAPRAFLLGGQSGAGKTKLQDILAPEFGNNLLVVNGDEYRPNHPRYYEIADEYGLDAPAHTAKWAGQMTEALIDRLSKMQYNLVIEGTLRTSEVPLKTARLLRSRSYSVSLALMAVKPEISLISCQIRYEQMRIAGTVPRSVDPKHHERIVKEISANLSVLEQSELFDEIRLYTRSRKCLYPKGGGTETASEVLREVLFGSWIEEEKTHLMYLQSKLNQLHQE